VASEKQIKASYKTKIRRYAHAAKLVGYVKAAGGSTPRHSEHIGGRSRKVVRIAGLVELLYNPIGIIVKRMVRIFVNEQLHGNQGLLRVAETGQTDAFTEQCVRTQIALRIFVEKTVVGLNR
jgi:hypothetical protein